MTRIEFIRRNAGLSQVELARLINVHPTSIVHVERGHRKPWPKIRKQIAEALRCQEKDLFSPEGWPLMVELKAVN